MKHNTNNEINLKEKDKTILKNLDKLMALDKQKSMINYYYNKNDLMSDIKKHFNPKLPVYTVDDLLDKYKLFNVTYDSVNNILKIRRAIPVNIYTLLKKEADQFEFSDIMVIATDYDRIHL